MNTEAFESYKSYLQKQPVSAHTRRNYLQRVRNFLTWLDGCPDGDLPLSDPVERDFQMREFKAFMLQHGACPSTVNGVLSAVDNFYLSRGMDAGKVKRLDLPRQAPRALQPDEEKRLLKTLMRVSPRNRALIMLLWHTGLRISEAAALNIEDLTLTARTGQVRVRCGKGLKQRSIGINAELRAVLHAYMSGQVSRAAHEPLFLSQKRSRLSVASIDRIVRQLGRVSGIELSAHDMRHNFISHLVRSGVDVVLVAELVGHGRLETVRRYSLPTEDEKQQALEKLCHAS
jgi:site-specific recombinase XerD